MINDIDARFDENDFQVSDHKELIELKNGNSKAFDFFYKKYRSRLLANILKLTKSPEIAADILQEVFVAIWHRRAGIDTTQSFENYIFRIGQNKIYDFFRKASRDKKLEEKLIMLSVGKEYNPIEHDLHLKEDFDLIKIQIARLPPKCREVFTLCKVEGKSYSEVAEILNISTATVNNHIVKATKILKTNFTGVGFVLVLLVSRGF
jgi:RNA polymerase sigma-70 factor (family 1)